MRFLNTTSLRFEEVPDSELSQAENQYAILSHRWGRDIDEVTYEDMTSSIDLSHKKGFVKIKEFCSLAARSGYSYGWVDTCCINKGNSSELAEAINSMYMWYKLSTLCIVYLEDVSDTFFEKSEWFDRGWTLQELIAPRAVTFFNRTWELIGTKLELLDSLSQKTGIPKDVLVNIAEPSSCSVAQRMSWAAQRVTKRVEDRAYSLLGLFDVNMSMIYGEREKAFLRLQQHIIRMSKDESLFAWALKHTGDAPRAFFGIFAPNPSAFRDCSGIVPTQGSEGFEERNGELCISVLCRWHSPGISRAFLKCTDETLPGSMVFITISKVFGDETFVRIQDLEGVSEGIEKPIQGDTRTIKIPIDPKTPPVTIFFGFWLRTLQPPGHDRSDITILSSSPAPEAGYIRQTRMKQGITGIVRLQPKDNSDTFKWSKICWIRFSFDDDMNPLLWFANDTLSDELQSSLDKEITPQQSGVQSQENDPIIMRNSNSLMENEKHLREFKSLHTFYEWPEGRAQVPINRRTGLHDFLIPHLNLRVSVRLQPCHSPARATPQNANERNPASNTMLIWVVDITATNGTIIHHGPVMRENWEFWLNWTCLIIYCPCLATFTGACAWVSPRYWTCEEDNSKNVSCYDYFYPFCKEKWLQDKEMRMRLAYEADAGLRIPVLIPEGGTIYTPPTIRGMCFWTDFQD